MFINIETGAPAWLLEQDTDVVFCTNLADVQTRDSVHVCSSFEFFSRHREATRDELDGVAADTKLVLLGHEGIDLSADGSASGAEPVVSATEDAGGGARRASSKSS